jgi:hypothetical protein
MDACRGFVDPDANVSSFLHVTGLCCLCTKLKNIRIEYSVVENKVNNRTERVLNSLIGARGTRSNISRSACAANCST